MWKKIKERVICMELEYIYLVCQCNYEYELPLFYFDNEEDARTYIEENQAENEYWLDLKMFIRKFPKYNNRG